MNPAPLLPLSGIRVVEFAALGPAPLAGQILRQMGAEVVLIDRPHPDAFSARLGPRDNPLHAGKQRIVLDLKSPHDRARAHALVCASDVLLEGYRPGVMERLGLGPAAFAAQRPQLVYARMTGWGQSGPLAPRAGHDLNYVALSGLLSLAPDCGTIPPVPPTALGDAPGALGLAFGIVCALFQRQQSGRGCLVDGAIVDVLAMLSGILHWLAGTPALGARTACGQGPSLFHDAPFYALYTCADGKKISVAALEPAFYRRLLAKLELDDVDPERQYESQDWPSLRKRFAEVFARRPRDEWAALFANEDACVAPVLSFEEAPHHPHQLARENFRLAPGSQASISAAPRLYPLAGEG
ncbi:MAG: CoA transferase [Rhodocyclaceae bacterium]|nr:CoA transferase [Rhodocyclaceae bacterium]